MLFHINEIRDLNSFQKSVLIDRQSAIIKSLRFRVVRQSIFYHTSRFIVTVGSLLVPALLSVQYSANTHTGGVDMQIIIYWSAWVLSLFVTVFNGLLSIFKIDKKQQFLHAVYENLKNEMWQQLHLTGKQGGILLQEGVDPNHSNQFIFICHAINKIKMRQVEEEQLRIHEASGDATDKNGNKVENGDVGAGGTDDKLKRQPTFRNIKKTPITEQLMARQVKANDTITQLTVDGSDAASESTVGTVETEAFTALPGTPPGSPPQNPQGWGGAAAPPMPMPSGMHQPPS